jgi:hypothetical protein
MKVKIELELIKGSAAYLDWNGNKNFPEYGRILKHQVSKKLEKLPKNKKIDLLDINNNVCGFIEITE